MNRTNARAALVAALLVSIVFAQGDAPDVGGYALPAEVWAAVSSVAGLVVKAIAAPLTELLKKWLKVKGVSVQLLYTVLVTLVTAGYGAAVGAYGQGSDGWLSAVIAAVVAIVKGFGDYEALKRTSVKGAEKALSKLSDLDEAARYGAGER